MTWPNDLDKEMIYLDFLLENIEKHARHGRKYCENKKDTIGTDFFQCILDDTNRIRDIIE